MSILSIIQFHQTKEEIVYDNLRNQLFQKMCKTNYDVEDQKELIKKLCWYDLLFLIKCTQTQIPENLVSDMKVQILYRLM